MKAILITLFLCFELFHCKTVNKGKNVTRVVPNKSHNPTKETASILYRIRKQLQKEGTVLRSKDNENTEVPKFRQRDIYFPNYDVTELFWGGQPGLDGTIHEDITSTFLPTLEKNEVPVITLAPTTEEIKKTEQSPEEINDDAWPILQQPPITRSTGYALNTNYPGYPYEPPPLDFPQVYFTKEAYKHMPNDKMTEAGPSFNDRTQMFKNDYGYFDKESDIDKYYGITNKSYFVTFAFHSEVTRRYSFRTEAFPSYVTLPPDIDKLYTLKPIAMKPTFYTNTPSTTTPSTTKPVLANYLPHNVQRANLRTNITISEKDVENVKKWFNKVTSGTPVHKWISFSAKLTTMPQENTTLSKSQWWLQQMKNFGVPVHKESLLSASRSLPSTTVFNFPTVTGQTIRETEGYEILNTTSKNFPLTSTTSVTGLPGSAVKVLHGDDEITTTPMSSAKQGYYKMMVKRYEGFLPIFLVEILRITIEKDKNLVKEVLVEVKPHVDTWYGTNRPIWLGEPLADVIIKLSGLISEAKVDYVRSSSSMMYQLLKARKTDVAVDVNSIIEFADLLYVDDEGEQLFDAIVEYEQYPNGTKNAKQLCEFLFDSFMRPYLRLSHSERRQTLLDSINTALKIRFPSRRSIESIFKTEALTTNRIKSIYLQEMHQPNRHRKQRNNNNHELADNVIRLDYIKRNSTLQYVDDLKPPVITNYYIRKTYKLQKIRKRQ